MDGFKSGWDPVKERFDELKDMSEKSYVVHCTELRRKKQEKI